MNFRGGTIRLWIVISALWSIGWVVLIVSNWAQGEPPTKYDVFAAPLVVAAPWLVTAAVLAAGWVVAGFRQPLRNGTAMTQPAVALAIFAAIVIGAGLTIEAIRSTYLRPSLAERPGQPRGPWQLVVHPEAHQLTGGRSGFYAWRLHTVTGELDFCGIEGDDWKCLPVAAWTTGSGGQR
jgi:hypothetical protein